MYDNTDDNPSSSTEQTPTDDGAHLDRIRPSTVLDLYLDERKSDLADSTRRSHRYVIEQFVDWCEETEKMTVLPEGRDVYSVTTESGNEYRVDAREGRCTCPDYQHNDATCKHIRRVEYATGSKPLPEWADRDAVDGLLGEHVDATPRDAVADGGDVIVAGDGAEILDGEDEGDGRPDECQCWDPDNELPCWPCYREGFRDANPKATDD